MNHLRVIITVELLPGTEIRDACCDLCELADRLGCTVEANFNGVTLLANGGDNPLDLMASWQKEVTSSHATKIASARRGK